MTDLQTMFDRATRHGAQTPPPDSVINDDVTRGHRALTRHRTRRVAGRSMVAGALALGAFAVAYPQSAVDRPTTPPAAAATTDTHETPGTTAGNTPGTTSTASLGIRLVSYTGAQPEGFTVESVPAGWEIQGVNNNALVIAATGDPDKSLGSFAGKLLVMLQSTDITDIPDGVNVMVGTRPGVISYFEASTAQLFFTDAAGHKVDIQVPQSLSWSDAEIAAFGAAVHVNPNAQAGRG
ncbi:MAG: hypothetical protein JWM93_3793 [Frankiales bacterium]|nr:hypothetical protein [Frankiales bacterium]